MATEQVSFPVNFAIIYKFTVPLSNGSEIPDKITQLKNVLTHLMIKLTKCFG